MFDQQGPTDQQDGSQVPGPGVQQPSAEMPLPPPQTSGLAIASLVCGIVGFVSCGLGGLVGLILGIWAMVKITDNPLKRKGRGLAIAGICVSAVSLLIGLFVGATMGLTMPALGRARTEARKAACMGNQHNLGLSFAMYSNDYFVLPPDLDALYPEYVDALGTFDCPGRGGGWTSHPGVEASGSYRYVGALNPAVDPSVIIMYDKAGNHADGRVALFVDAHVEFVREEDLAASLELVKEAGWDEYSEERKEEIEAFYKPD